jgi:hypothetical protein
MISFFSALLESPTVARWTLVLCVTVQVVPFLLSLVRRVLAILITTSVHNPIHNRAR